MNPYEILEITPNASAEEIKEAYHRLAKKWHPDRFMGPEHEEAEKRFRQLAEAFSMLKNSGRPAPVPTPEPAPAAEPEAAPIALNAVPPASRTAQDWYSEAKAAFENRDMPRALSLVHYALKMDAEQVDFHLLLAKLLDHPGGDVRKLVQTLETVLRLNPKEVNSAIRLAELYQSVGLSTKATRMWETVRRIAPGHPIFHQPTKSSPLNVQGLSDQLKDVVKKLKGLFGK
jgi:hypothetical protein